MKKVLVTGATGFIGRYVVQQLLSRNMQVIATASSEDSAKKHSWFQQVRFIPFNLASLQEDQDYFRFFDRPDLMIHLAWEGLPHYKSDFHTEINLPRHRQLLQNMVEHGLTDVAVTGTCLEYGMQEGALREEMPSQPGNPYALAKDQLRKYLEHLQQQYAFSLKWIRLFYMYGEGQNVKSLISQLDKALEEKQPVFDMSGGEQVRDFLPVEKVAEFIVRISTQKRVNGIINCCSGVPVTVRQFVEDYLRKKSAHISLNLGHYPYQDYEPMKFWGDDTKLKTILDQPFKSM